MHYIWGGLFWQGLPYLGLVPLVLFEPRSSLEVPPHGRAPARPPGRHPPRSARHPVVLPVTRRSLGSRLATVALRDRHLQIKKPVAFATGFFIWRFRSRSRNSANLPPVLSYCRTSSRVIAIVILLLFSSLSVHKHPLQALSLALRGQAWRLASDWTARRG